jgi:broad specificity phosphatase PhoE
MRHSVLPSATLVAALGLGLGLPGTAAAQQAVIVVRHAENNGDTLTEAGLARARRLAEVLADAGVRAIYTTDTKRTRGTAAPLAAARGLKVQLYDVGHSPKGVDARAFAATLRTTHPDDVVLVVGHSDTIGGIVKALGCAEEVTIAAPDYDNLLVVVPKGAGAATLVRLSY